MCGIVGYIGSGESTAIVRDGLQNLEYRGYDSAGVALVNSDLEVFKQTGTVGDIDIPDIEAVSQGVGHTRWSTHGEPTDANAHPHTDCTGSVAVVHNGIISNYDELKADLDAHVFESQTDTEVVPHLIEDALAAGAEFLPAVTQAVAQLEGSYAIAVTHADTEEVIVARQDSPLVVGHGDSGIYIGSDVTAFAEFTRRVSYLKDGDIASLTADGLTVYNDGQRVTREIKEIDWDTEAAEKAGHDHYMHKEIHEQPHALRQTLSGRIKQLEGEVDLDIDLEALFNGVEFIDIIACGTSYHAGLVAQQLLETHTDFDISVTYASEYEPTNPQRANKTVVLPITQSGETADTLAALRDAQAVGMDSLAITNTVGSTVTREVDESLFIRAGPEIGVAATKTFVSQVATLTLLSVALGRYQGTLPSDKRDTVLESLQALPGAVQTVLDSEAQIERLAEEYADADSFFFIGRRLGHPVALESALKLKEISYDHAEGFPSGELKHGPLALVTPKTPVIALLTAGTEPRETLHNVKEVESRGASVIGLSTLADAELYCAETVDLPEIGVLESIVANVATQLLAYHVAKLQDRNIDKPRNLAKSVTVH
jgi:glucosamine--fructose-6-phosphate aminotransferase (isomerizing)